MSDSPFDTTNWTRDMATFEDVPSLRHELVSWLAGLGVDADTRYAVGLAAGEILANALKHGGVEGGRLRLSAYRVGSQVRFQVWDNTTTEPRVLDAGDGWESGRGMGMVDALEGAWGAQQDGVGKAVYWQTADYARTERLALRRSVRTPETQASVESSTRPGSGPSGSVDFRLAPPWTKGGREGGRGVAGPCRQTAVRAGRVGAAAGPASTGRHWSVRLPVLERST
ncbi:ATP-binding protein [Embleya sp. MST-111070]|uniref:ATP-binding protein n=1 Tax=Embleya sp. MST-111070 TaxID=3398231 RepID=UPI003F7400C5